MSRGLPLFLLLALPAVATERFVAVGGTGSGGADDPFGTIAEALAESSPGDFVTVSAGTYDETVTTVRNGSAGLPIVLRAAPAADVRVQRAGRLLNVNHAYFTVEGIVFDAEYAFEDAVKVQSSGNNLTLRNVEIRRATKDCVDMISPQNVLIDGARIHHCLNSAGGRTDAHGIVAAAVVNLTVRNTEIHTVSGDSMQIDPDRLSPGWDNVLIEGCHFWQEPLPAAENGFAAGAMTAENAFDTKTYDAPPRRSRLFVRDSVMHGFRSTFISNAAAFNMKESVDARFERVTVYDSEIAFRTRGPTEETPIGAVVNVHNVVIWNVDKAFRFENDIARLQIYNTTLGRGVLDAFQAASSGTGGLDVRNLLVLGEGLPPEVSAASGNLAVAASSFVDPDQDDYHLVDGSPAVDTGTTIAAVSDDRDRNVRPVGAGYDVGAYEGTGAPALPPDAGTDGGFTPDPVGPVSGLDTVVTGCTCDTSGAGGGLGVLATALALATAAAGARARSTRTSAPGRASRAR